MKFAGVGAGCMHSPQNAGSINNSCNPSDSRPSRPMMKTYGMARAVSSRQVFREAPPVFAPRPSSTPVAVDSAQVMQPAPMNHALAQRKKAGAMKTMLNTAAHSSDTSNTQPPRRDHHSRESCEKQRPIRPM